MAYKAIPDIIPPPPTLTKIYFIFLCFSNNSQAMVAYPSITSNELYGGTNNQFLSFAKFIANVLDSSKTAPYFITSALYL